ncbi:formimidoylglutamase [Formosa haliotis]|uniref:formimidoylglutamase n=1 Tax=Formosa haliotis TaxID=1555194 RepID=UPI0008262D81|nr:formimidoylglutamase [Formosa haliotis]
MDKLVVFNNSDLSKFLNIRPFESKFGEHINLLPPDCNIYEYIETLDVEYVLVGLPEDVGVFANLGDCGASTTWETTLKYILNIQKNEFTQPEKVLILGHLDFEKELKKIQTLDRTIEKELAKARKLVSKIDKHVTHLVYTLIKAGKKPILIGGGHNNAYGNIKGAALALNDSINAINFDAHTHFRAEEGRHSGNSFTYAFTEGFLNQYYMFGLHESYISNSILKTINKLNNVNYSTYEDIEVKNKSSFKKELQKALALIENKPFGLEIDCDAIENINCSAMSPGGFNLKRARQFVHYFGKQNHATYLHICEAVPNESNETQIGMLIAYLISDFIQANSK